MKKAVFLLAALVAMTLNVHATKYTVTIVNFTYSPSLLSTHIGDTVTINAGVNHPLAQVSRATWLAGGSTVLSGGFGPLTANYTFKVATADTIYYVCTAHVSFGMKGRIVVAPSAGIDASPIQTVSVNLFPNPVTTTATVKVTSAGESPLTLKVFGINGQLEKDLTPNLTEINGEHYCVFDTGDLAAGNHFLQVTEGMKKSVRKFVVIH
jgi:plastocyanin